MIAASFKTPFSRRFAGTLQIVRFNWPRFAAGAACVVVAMTLAIIAPNFAPWILAAAVPATVWMIASLIVSYWVYDYAPTLKPAWLPRVLGGAPQNWVNIHCGFDATSEYLHGLLHGDGIALNIFDPKIMTERSLKRAQGAGSRNSRVMAARFDHLAITPESVDAVFLLFSAHELRAAAERATLFLQVATALKPGAGRLVVLEHLRDSANFAAFGPGFLHFFARRQWLWAGQEAGLQPVEEFSITPFVRCFVWSVPCCNAK